MRNGSKSGAFLVELIIVIAFFALASATCIRLFAYAHLTSSKSHNITMATNTFQSAAESFKASGGEAFGILAALPGSELQSAGHLTVFYDKNWNPVTQPKSRYHMEILLDYEDYLSVADIGIYIAESQELLYQGKVYSYV